MIEAVIVIAQIQTRQELLNYSAVLLLNQSLAS